MELSISQLIRILPAQYLRTLSTAVGRALPDEISHDSHRPATDDDLNRIGDALAKMSDEVFNPVIGDIDIFCCETPEQKAERQISELRTINEAADVLRGAYLTITDCGIAPKKNDPLPAQVIILDKDRTKNPPLTKGQPPKAFYLRITEESGAVKIVDLDGALTPGEARKIAHEKGYNPSHWMEARPWAYGPLPSEKPKAAIKSKDPGMGM